MMIGGRLHPDGIPERGPWEGSRLRWWPEDHPDLVLTTTRGRKVRGTEELEAAIREPMNVAPTRNVWIDESLEDEARRVWHEGRAKGYGVGKDTIQSTSNSSNRRLRVCRRRGVRLTSATLFSFGQGGDESWLPSWFR
jgi:hypothetical protein